MQVDYKYRAFLSYSHADSKWASWLHRRLEGFRLRELGGRAGARGAVPAKLAPIFRDREEFTAGHSFSDQTLSALEASEALIVLCSPAAAKSHNVNEEIRLFKARHPDRLIVPLIADGKPGDAEQECFPPALRFKVGPDGSLSSEREPDLLAADLRETGDGRELALAKAIAALIGLPPDHVYRRAERERQRQLRLRITIAAAFVCISVTGAFYLWQSRQREVVLLDTAAACARYMPANIPSASPVGTLEQCIKSLEALRLGAASDPRDAVIVKLIAEGKTEEAERLQLEAARDDESAGKARNKKAAQRHRTIAATAGLADSKKEREHYAKAAHLDPEDSGGMFFHGQAEMRAGNVSVAEKAFEAVLQLKDTDEFTQYLAFKGLGQVHGTKGNFPVARHYVELALAEAKRLADRFPGVPPFERGLSLCYSELGILLGQMGDSDGEVEAFRNALLAAQRIATPSSTDLLLAGHLAGTHASLAIALTRKGAHKEAMEQYRQGIPIYERLVIAYPKDRQVQRGLSVSYLSVGRELARVGEHSDALKLANDGLAIARRLADLDSDNPVSGVLLAEAYMTLGGVLSTLKKIEEAIQAYRASVSILEHPSRDPTDLSSQSTLADVYWEIARLTPDPRVDGVKTLTILEELDKQGRLAPERKKFLDGVRTDLARAETRAGLWGEAEAAAAAFTRREYSDAVEKLLSVVHGFENLETQEGGGPGANTAHVLGLVSYHALFARRFDLALASTERALMLVSSATWIATNRAHAHMFLEQPDEARALHLKHKGMRIGESNKPWEEEIISDFAEFEKAGLVHPQMAEIRALLSAPNGSAKRNNELLVDEVIK